MSDTPRTDAMLVTMGAAGNDSKFSKFARELERELAEAKAKYAAECEASMMAGSQLSALRLQLKDAEERSSRFAKSADFLSQALNEGDGSYKP